MARDINSVFVIGRLVKDPEIRYTPSGTPVTKFSIANNISYMQNKEVKESVNYFDINVWGNQAVNCEKYLKKGRQVAINGSIRQNRWVDKASGQNRSKIEITALSVQYLGQGSGESPMPQKQENVKQIKDDVYEDPWADTPNNGAFDESNPFDDSSTDDDIPF